MKIYTNELVHMTNMAVMPIYGKNFKKNLLLQNQWTDNLETLYIACPCKYYQVCSNYDHGLTLTPFTPRSDLAT